MFEEFDNCYLVGGDTHLGSGLPTILESARLSSILLLKKDKLELERFIENYKTEKAIYSINILNSN